jgi:hypothetical protein
MRTTRFLTATLALMMFFGAAQAQITPEAVIGQCPTLPSAATLSAYRINFDVIDNKNRAAEEEVGAFLDQISSLRERAKRASEQIGDTAGTAARNDAERLTKQKTGRSIAELKSMSSSEQEAMGKQMAQKQLKSAGLSNMSLESLQALEGKSESEIMAALSGGGATFGGLSPDELQAMDGMSEQQLAAYMQQGDRMQRMQNSHDPAKVKEGKAAAQKAMSQQQIAAETQQIRDRWDEIARLMEKESLETDAQLTAISDKYYPEMHEIAAKYFDGKVDATPAEIEAASARHAALSAAMIREKAPVWRNHVAKMMSRIKSKMADAQRMDELQRQSTSHSGMTATGKINMQAYAYTIADDYLNMAKQVTNF